MKTRVHIYLEIPDLLDPRAERDVACCAPVDDRPGACEPAGHAWEQCIRTTKAKADMSCACCSPDARNCASNAPQPRCCCCCC